MKTEPKLELIKLLTEGRADVNLIDALHGKSSLHFACLDKKIDVRIILHLVEKGGDYSLRDLNNGDTPLHTVCESDFGDAFLIFLARGDCDLDLTDSFGFTPRSVAERKDSRKCLVLIEEYEENSTVWNKERHPLFPELFKGAVKTLILINKFYLPKKTKMPKPVLEICIRELSKNPLGKK